MFTRDEIVALVAGARLIRAWGGAEMARAAEEALVKIEAVLPEAERARANQVEIHAIAEEMTPQVRARIDEIERAVEARRRLALAYIDAEEHMTERTVRPLGLWFWGKVWTLVAWCELRDDFRMFRLDRIERMDNRGEPFRPERGKTLADFYRTMEERP
jgi:predicted DNA-binding transcriptional regulator YafY